MTRMRGGHLSLGGAGWLVLSPGATGVRSELRDGALLVDGRQASGTPAGGVAVFTPRRNARPGHWTGQLEVRCTPAALIDLALVAGRAVPVPGPPPTPVAYTAIAVGADHQVLTVHRELGDDDLTVGLRLRAPLGCLVEVRRVDVSRSGDTETETAVVVVRGARAPFGSGALCLKGEVVEIEVVVAGCGRGRLRVALEDRYRGTEHVLLDTDVELGVPRNIPVPLVLEDCGAFAVVARLDVGSERTLGQLRLLVDDDLTRPVVDAAHPWGVTIDTEDLDASGALLGLLGVPHVRTYSGFAAWDLPAVLAVTDPVQSAAVVDALDFIGASAGSPAALAAHAASGRQPGLPTSGWPAWRTAAGLLAGTDDGLLAPHASLLDPLRGRTVLAEMSQLDDLEAWSHVAEVVSRGLAGRQVAWLAANEPDLGLADTAPEQVALASSAFARGVRAGDPAALVVGPALADGWDGGHQGLTGWDWLTRWALAGGASAVDAISVHLHMLDEPTLTPEREDFEGLLERLQTLLASIAPERPLWVTEMGWRSQPDASEAAEPGESGPSVTEADQADLLVRAAVLAASAGVQRFYAFHLHGFRATGEGHRFAWGLCAGHSGGPKPGFGALRRLCRMTAGRRVAAPLRTSARVRAVPFLGAESDLHVVWQWSGGPGLWCLVDSPAAVTITDLLGAATLGQDLRRPHLVTSAALDRPAIQRWLQGQLAPRHGEAQHIGLNHTRLEVSDVPHT